MGNPVFRPWAKFRPAWQDNAEREDGFVVEFPTSLDTATFYGVRKAFEEAQKAKEEEAIGIAAAAFAKVCRGPKPFFAVERPDGTEQLIDTPEAMVRFAAVEMGGHLMRELLRGFFESVALGADAKKKSGPQLGGPGTTPPVPANTASTPPPAPGGQGTGT